MSRIVLPLVLLFSIVAPEASAARVDDWNAGLRKSLAALQNGQYAASLKVTESVSRDMLDYLGRGESASRALSLVNVHRAFANYGLGRVDDALWYWYVALSLYPAIARSDFSSLGSLPCYLLEQPFPAEPKAEKLLPGTGVLEPVELRRVAPTYPEGARQFRVTGFLEVEVLITAEGRIAYPRVITDLPAPTMTFSALEAVRQWRYRPATLNGDPVPVFLTLTVTFRLE